MLRALLVPLCVATLATTFRIIPVQAATKNWIGGNGLWSSGGNWFGGTVPALNDTVNIPQFTVTYDVSAPPLGVLTVDEAGFSLARTRFVMSANNLTTAGFLLGSDGRATFDQSGGTNTTNNPGLDSVLGHFSTGDGIYNLSGTGALSIARDLYVGNFGKGAFNQTGGTNIITSNLFLAAQSNSSGVYTLSGGALSTGGNLFVGGSGTGTFNHSGGTNTINASAVGIFSVGRNPGSMGTYNLSGTGALVANESEYIGNSGKGVFNQTGGTNTISGAGNGLYLGFGSSGLGGTYNLSGGTVTAPEVFVGHSSTGGPSSFTITGAGSRVNATSFVVGRTYIGQLTLADGGTLAIGNGTNPLQIAPGGGGDIGDVFIGNGGAAGVLQASAVEFGQTGVPGGFGELKFNHTGNLTFATPIRGLCYVTKSGPGTTTLSGANSYFGTTYLDGGTLAISADANLGTAPGEFYPYQLVFNGGTLRATQSFTMAATRGINIGAIDIGTIEVDATKTLTYPNNLSLSQGTMHKTGAGTLSLGNLSIGGSGASALSVIGGGTLATGGTEIGVLTGERGYAAVYGPGTTWATTSLRVGVSGKGTLEILDGGTVTSTADSFLASFAGSTGTATVRGAGSTWNVGGYLLVGIDGGTVNIEDQALVYVGQQFQMGFGSIVNLSGGTLRFDGYSRAANVTFNFNSGTIQLAGNRSVGTDVAIADLFGAAPIIPTGKGLTVEGTATMTKTVTLDGGTFTVGGLVNGSDLLVNRGTLNITNQALTVGNAGSFGPTLIINPNMTINVTNQAAIDPGAEMAVFGQFSSGGLTNHGDLILADTVGTGKTLHGSLSTHAGSTVTVLGTINFADPVSGGGQFFGPGTANFNGGYSPGNSPAAVGFEGDVGFGSANTLQIELGGVMPGTQFDQLVVAGDLTLDGTLEVSILPSLTPAAGQSFNILDWLGTRTGTFSSLTLPTLAGLAWNTTQLYTAGILSLTAAGLPGDYNQNGIVDAADYVVWRNGLGSIYTQTDYDVWRTHFAKIAGSGSVMPSAELLSAAVPEPASFTLLLFATGTLGLINTRRHRRPWLFTLPHNCAQQLREPM